MPNAVVTGSLRGIGRAVAEAVAYRRDAGFVTGETLNANGGELMC
jgi:NAD(P)-dependent dehydrogenase (short-subunit alcohol dehydrogenase family)